jgi:hypothetical protein
MLNRIIEIHDSVLSKVSFDQNEAQLHFSALYVHESDGEPGIDAGQGWFQQAVIRIHNAKVNGAFTNFPVDLATGRTRIENITFENTIPIPLHHEGAFELQLQAMWDEAAAVVFVGSGAELELLGEPGDLEEFRP